MIKGGSGWHVVTNDGQVLIQIQDAESRWGFYLADEDQTYDGGFGCGATSWQTISQDDPKITQADHDRLDFLLTEE